MEEVVSGLGSLPMDRASFFGGGEWSRDRLAGSCVAWRRQRENLLCAALDAGYVDAGVSAKDDKHGTISIEPERQAGASIGRRFVEQIGFRCSGIGVP